ncbi:MAG: DUF4418 family protein [Clostridia bacterium]|nr:DUF4418 family protein [Clostridia bacterium]
MKKGSIPAVVMLVLALVIVVGGQTVLTPCIHEDGSFGACHWAGQALLGLGCVLGVMAALCLSIAQARPGIYIGALPVCVMGILTPGTLIDLCRMQTMHCRMVMQPAMIILFSAAFLSALTGAILTWRK